MTLLVGSFIEIINNIIAVMLQWWWLAAPVIAAIILWESWLYYIRIKFVSKIDWVLLELIVPQEVIKTPLAMEQIFAGLHSSLYKGSWWLQYVGGRVQEWFSFEIVSLGGEIHFFIRTPTKFRNLVESQIYAQYPEAEIHEVEDYTAKVPVDVPNETYNLFGAEFVLAKEDAYPIRTYEDFEFETEEGLGNIDPLAALTEALGKLKAGEQFWLQIGIKPVDDKWKEPGEKLVAKLIGRKIPEKDQSFVMALLKKEAADYVKGASQALFKMPEYGEFKFGDKKGEGPHSLIQFLSPGEQEVVKAIERNIAKVGFETVVRCVYTARREVFNIQSFFAPVAAFRQFSTQHLNALRWNVPTITASQWPFKKAKENYRKRWLFFKYRFRFAPQHSFVFNIEELSTIFHFPGRIVASPNIPRIGSKKGEPPLGLPTY